MGELSRNGEGSNLQGLAPHDGQLQPATLPPTDLERRLYSALRKLGMSEFREGQKEGLTHLFAGSDISVNQATGHGKSLFYQLPAAAGEFVLVFSPLIALMRDQVEALKAKGIPAAALHSGLSTGERETIYHNVEKGDVDLLFVTPERVERASFLQRLQTFPEPYLIAVDEAHCVSAWGHDFRPSFQKIGRFRNDFYKNARMGTFTATAPPRVEQQIHEILGLKNPWSYRGPADRPEIELEIVEVESLKHRSELLRERMPEAIRHGSTIVYTSLIRTALEVSKIADAVGVPHRVYHGQLDPRLRERAQQEFMDERVPLIIATTAFGMGIDKPNIRREIVVEQPDNLEGLWQLIGRVSRDREPGKVELFALAHDVDTHRRFDDLSVPSATVINDLFWNRILPMFSPAQLRHEVPTRSFNKEVFLLRAGQPNSTEYAQANSALAILEQQEFILIAGRRIAILKHPEDMPERTLPIDMEDLTLRRQRREYGSRLLVYALRDSETFRKTAVEYLESGTVPDADLSSDAGLIHIPKKQVRAIRGAAQAKSLTEIQLLDHLRGKRNIEGVPHVGVLSDLTTGEGRFLIKLLKERGDIEEVRLANRKVLNWTGEQAGELDDTFADLDELFGQLQRPEAHNVIRNSVNSWWEERRDFCESNGTLWRISLEGFLDANFEILDEKLSGRALLSRYHGTKEGELRTVHTLLLLENMFPDFEIPLL
ncbi:MAG: ATP-dependent DNA helicase RecQ [Bdellovibrionales bacterium]|nr:ATP-dependent DNA helicase RecQ [Bdellovibrionales bacterium]